MHRRRRYLQRSISSARRSSISTSSRRKTRRAFTRRRKRCEFWASRLIFRAKDSLSFGPRLRDVLMLFNGNADLKTQRRTMELPPDIEFHEDIRLLIYRP